MSQEPVITIVQGETKRFRVRVKSRATGAPIDLTGAVITSQIKRTYNATTVEGGFTIELDDLTNGSFYMSLTEAASNGIPDGRHVFDVRIEFADGTVKKRPRGQVLVLPGVTNG